MTAKDFDLIAAALRAAKPSGKGPQAAYIGWVRCVTKVTEALATTNPRFDRDRFVTACNGNV